MINFFRKIRKKLADNNQFLKYLNLKSLMTRDWESSTYKNI